MLQKILVLTMMYRIGFGGIYRQINIDGSSDQEYTVRMHEPPSLSL